MVKQALQIAFQCEFHILAKYVECIFPLMYSLFKLVLFHVPNVQYYTDMAEMTPAHHKVTIFNIVFYAWLEVVSFIALHFVVKRKLGLSPPCVLAFALESQFV